MHPMCLFLRDVTYIYSILSMLTFFEFSFKSVIFFLFIFSVSFLDVSQNCKHAFSDRLSFLILFCEEFPPCFLQLLHSSIGDEIKRYYFLPLLNLPSSRDLQDTFHYVIFFSQSFLLTLLLNYQNSDPTK